MQVLCRFRSVIIALIQFLFVFSVFVQQSYSGTLDPNFGTGGRFTTDFPFTTSSQYTSFGHNVFVQPSGRIVGVGIHFQPGSDPSHLGIVMAGVTPAGTIDTTFGGGGKTLDWENFSFLLLTDTKMLPDGRILYLSQYVSLSNVFTTFLRRTNVDGSIDSSFLPDLQVGESIPYPGRVAVAPDGKVYVIIITNVSGINLHLVRLNPDGSRDASFGVNGVRDIPRISPSPDWGLFDMHVLPNGKIVIAGNTAYTSSDYREIFVLRLDPDGNVDHSFGRLGLIRHRFEPGVYASDLIVQPDNKYLITGFIKTPDRDSFMMRFTQRGRLDHDFGNAGMVVTDFTAGGDDNLAGAAISSTGKILVAGQAFARSTAFSNFLVAQYSLTGTLEASTQTAFTPSQNSGAEDVTIQPDGKILVIGYTRNPNTAVNGNVFAFARYTSITND